MKRQQVEEKDEQIVSEKSERELWIQEAAYFMAEARGFIPGCDKEDWNSAEKKYANIVAA